MTTTSVMVLEHDPLWAAMVRRVVATDESLSHSRFPAASSIAEAVSESRPDVVVIGESVLRGDAAPAIVEATAAYGGSVVALVETPDGPITERLTALGVDHAVPRSASRTAIADLLRRR